MKGVKWRWGNKYSDSLRKTRHLLLSNRIRVRELEPLFCFKQYTVGVPC